MLDVADLPVRFGRERGPVYTLNVQVAVARMTSMTNDDRRGSPLVPFSLRIDVLDRMLNLEIADDPVYQGLEIQVFDDPDHGRGMTVFLSRRADGRTDVYYQPGLELDPTTYAIGGGLGAWVECEFEVGRLAISPEGVDAEVRFTDVDGRMIEVRVGDRTRRERRTAAFLAPMGAAITDPRSLPLVWMSRFDLLRRTSDPPVIRIDGRQASAGRLPAEWLLRRRLIKVASDLCVVSVNPVEDDSVYLTSDVANGEVLAGPSGVQTIAATRGPHKAVLRFDPPFPDVSSPVSGATTGTWDLTIDATPIVAGKWSASRKDGEVRLGFDVTEGWRPTGLPMLMKVVTRVTPVFRRWPTTYRWTATVTINHPPSMTARWERTGTERGESYRALTGTE